jgi:glutamate-ammonia-ligase adenylyltransferase
MARDLPPNGPWDVKQRPGGQIDVEFIAQVLQLVHARTHPGICSPTTRVALRRLGDAGLLPAEDTALLIHADHVWRTVQGMLRLTANRGAPEALPEASARALLRGAAGCGITAVDLPALRAILDTLAQQVRAAFARHIGEIAA